MIMEKTTFGILFICLILHCVRTFFKLIQDYNDDNKNGIISSLLVFIFTFFSFFILCQSFTNQ